MSNTNQRQITSFEPDEDVARMLARVRKDGKIKSKVINEALRQFLREAGYARKKEMV